MGHGGKAKPLSKAIDSTHQVSILGIEGWTWGEGGGGGEGGGEQPRGGGRGGGGGGAVRGWSY